MKAENPGVLKKDNLKDFTLFKENLDIGDFIEAGGIYLRQNR